MARIVVISSHAAYGNIGGSAGSFILRRLGHEVWFLPTVILSNHPGHANVSRQAVEPEFLSRSLAAFEANGWAGTIDAVMTGYLPSAQHAVEAEKIVTRLKALNPYLFYLCDPIMGDDPEGLYIAEDAASAIRSELVPKADILTPNRFELGWLSGRPVDNAGDALSEARALDTAHVIATSLPDGENHPKIADLYVSSGNARLAEWKRRENVPHGSGDAFAALLLAHHLNGHHLDDHDLRGHKLNEAFALAVAGTRALIIEAEALQMDSLPLESSQDLWVAPEPVSLTMPDPIRT